MTPEYYADQFKRYATYVHNFGGNKVFKIACGPNGADTNWTEVLMREAGKRMDGLALHYYCGSSRQAQPRHRVRRGGLVLPVEECPAHGGAGHQTLCHHGQV